MLPRGRPRTALRRPPGFAQNAADAPNAGDSTGGAPMKARCLLVVMVAIFALAGSAEAKHRRHMNRAPMTKASFETTATDEAHCVQGGDIDGDAVPVRLHHCPGTPQGCTVDAYGCEYDSDGDGVCDGRDRCPNTPEGSEVNDEGCDAAQRAGGRAPMPAA